MAVSAAESGTGGQLGELGITEQAAQRAPGFARSRTRGIEQVRSIVDAARRLIDVRGQSFTTHELVAEAGIALNTFYRYFGSKDQLLLAVIENVIGESCDYYREIALEISDPVGRLRSHITSTLSVAGRSGSRPGFITAEHWRLQALFPVEVALATRPFTDLLLEEIEAAIELGRLSPLSPEYSAWLVTQLTMAVFHHYDSAGLDEPVAEASDRLWAFCLAALGGTS